MGISQELFVGKISTEFICSHCHDVFLEPTVLTCLHLLCSKCCKKRLKHRAPTCPICKKSLSESNEKVNKYWKARYESLKINCPKGCENVLMLGDLHKHYIHECELTVSLCVNLGCSRKIRRRDMPFHLKQCDFRIVCCEGCGFRTKYVNLRLHQVVQKCLRANNRRMIVQNRREMRERLKEHRSKLQEESFEIEIEERDFDRAKMWSAITRNSRSRSVTPNRFGGCRASDPSDGRGFNRFVQTAPPRSLAKAVQGTVATQCKLCAFCNKLFTENCNHNEACIRHKGCQACGKLDNLGGCIRSWHWSADQVEKTRMLNSSIQLV
ncbi:TNF receptor-associated factor 3 [Acropora cervicornis]|uniref:TNF receptor-associated factor 3 n=1 Tax=Acropora cervicornis TaxID=6130 RepID=A0AAD9QQE8_ACRCE|nr:TNF receptor-associated factor 3 [Acropora cervicornis]